MVGRPLEDCLMIPSVVPLLWLMAFIFKTAKHQQTSIGDEILFPNANFTSCCRPEWNVRLPRRGHTVIVCFCDHLADEEIGKLRLLKRKTSPLVAPHWLCLSSTHKFTDAHMQTLKAVATGSCRTASFFFSTRECDERSSLQTLQSWTWKVSAVFLSCNAVLYMGARIRVAWVTCRNSITWRDFHDTLGVMDVSYS